MHFKEIAPNRFRVQTSPTDTKFRGTVEKHEFVSIDDRGKRTPKSFWIVQGVSGGWRATSKQKFSTRKEAAEFLLTDNKQNYGDRKMAWKKNQGEFKNVRSA